MFRQSKSAKVTIVLLLSILLAACTPAQPTTPPEASPQPTVPPEASATREPEPSDESVLIAFAYTGSATDLGWTYAHDQARLAVEEAFPNVETVYAEFVPYSEEASRTFEQFVADGAKMIVATSEFDEFLYKVAEAHPDVVFLEVDAAKQYDNVISVFVDVGMPYYLVGMAAGLLTESNQLGFVTSFPMPISYTAVNAFQMGAQSVNPDVTTHVLLINSWYDPPAHRQAAEALVDDGADFIISNLDDAASIQVAEERGVWAGDSFADRPEFGPNAYTSSVLFLWKPVYVSEVGAFLEGTWEGNRSETWPLGVGTDLGPWGEKVPQEVIDKVEQVRQQMLNEGFNPFVGPLHDSKGELRVAEGEELSAEFRRREWNWPVEGVLGMDEE
jgi:basic membrane protein A